MKTLQITEENATKAWAAADATGKKMVEQLFPELFVKKDIKDRVKTFADACEVLGITPNNKVSISITGMLVSETKAVDAYCKLLIIAKALNEGWEPNWKNSSEYKYYPWFDFSGSSLSFYGCDCRYSHSIVGSRLCFKSRVLAEYAGKQFLEIYKDFMTF